MRLPHTISAIIIIIIIIIIIGNRYPLCSAIIKPYLDSDENVSSYEP